MSDFMSLADWAVEALSAVAAIESNLGMERPERHAIRNLKPEAEGVLEDAFKRAIGLAYAAQELPQLVQEVRVAEAKKAASAAD